MKKYLIIILPILTFVLGFALRGLFSEDNAVEILPAEKESLAKNEGVLVEKQKVQLSSVQKPKSKSKQVDEKPDDDIKGDKIDTLLQITTVEDTNTMVSRDTLKIKRDRLMSSKFYKIKNISSVDKNVDSLKKIGLNVQEYGFGDKIWVEFWESPFNYTGYKLGKAKLILYGFNPESKFVLSSRSKDTLKLMDEIDDLDLILTENFKQILSKRRDSL